MAVRQLPLRIVQAEISGTATELARERARHEHYRSSTEIARQLGGDLRHDPACILGIAACRAEFIIAGESS